MGFQRDCSRPRRFPGWGGTAPGAGDGNGSARAAWGAPRRFWLLAFLAALATTFPGCGTDVPGDVAVVRDSAGITIVENAPDAADPDRTIADEDVRTWIDSMVVMEPTEQRPAERRRLEATPVADMKPAHGRLLVDAAGRLWVNRWDLWADHLNDGPEWWVFDADGRMVATARMPNGFRAYDLGDGAVLGAHRDGMGVERVVRMPVSVREP